MRLKMMKRMPEYTDGVLVIYKKTEEKIGDFPKKIWKTTDVEICFRELAVFDRTRYEFEQAGKEINMKVRIPRYKGIDSDCACMIDEKIYQIYNAAHVEDKNGFLETELTLIRPEKELTIE